MAIMTRSQYMEGDTSSKHRAYYAQFVNEDVKARVAAVIGLTTLLYSTDEHLNDIPLKKWDAMGGFVFKGGEMIQQPYSIEPIKLSLLKEAGEGVSSAILVCIYKEAARQMIEEHKNK